MTLLEFLQGRAKASCLLYLVPPLGPWLDQSQGACSAQSFERSTSYELDAEGRGQARIIGVALHETLGTEVPADGRWTKWTTFLMEFMDRSRVSYKNESGKLYRLLLGSDFEMFVRLASYLLSDSFENRGNHFITRILSSPFHHAFFK